MTSHRPLVLLPSPNRLESSIIFRGGVLRVGLNLPLIHTFKPVVMLLVFAAFLGTNGTLVPLRSVFTVLSLVERVRRSSVRFLVRQFYLFSEAKVALTRIKVRILHCHWWADPTEGVHRPVSG